MPALRLSLEKGSSIFSCEMLTYPVVSRSNHFSSPTSNNTSYPLCNKCCEFDLFRDPDVCVNPAGSLWLFCNTDAAPLYPAVTCMPRCSLDQTLWECRPSTLPHTALCLACSRLHCHCLSITYSFSMLSLTEVIAQDLNTTVVSQAGKPSQKIPSMITANIVRSNICST